MQQLPWFAEIIRFLLPFVKGKANDFRSLAIQQAYRRVSEPVKRRDLFYHLVRTISLWTTYVDSFFIV